MNLHFNKMNCIVFFTNTYYLDDILPLIFELKKANLISSVVFITTKEKWFYYIKQNVVLHDGIKSLGGKLTYLSKYKNRYLNILYNIFLLRKLFYSKVLTIIGTNGIQEGSMLISKTLLFNQKYWNGKMVLSKIRNWPNDFGYLEYKRSLRGRKESKDEITKGYDAILYTKYPDEYWQELHAKLITDAKIIQVGNSRVMKEWTSFINSNIKKYISREVTTPYFFFPLSVTGVWMSGERCPTGREKLVKCLKVFKEYNNEILTVFKPHHKTDVNEFNEILETVNYTNYVISYLHPVMLIKNAKFTFVCSPSSLVWEACYNGCTTVEYADYDERADQALKGETLHTGCVDYFINRDVDKLEKIAEMLISNNEEAKRIHKRHEEKIPMPNVQEIIMNFRNLVL